MLKAELTEENCFEDVKKVCIFELSFKSEAIKDLKLESDDQISINKKQKEYVEKI